MPDDLFGRPLSLKELAHELGVSTRTVRRWVRERKFPPARHMPGGKPTWFARDVETFRYLLGRGLYEPDEPAEIPEDEE